MPGTFKRALSANPNVEMWFDHSRKICDQENGLTLREDNIGLYADASFVDEEVAEKARRNELRGWSFGFSVIKDHWDDSGKRYLDEINLHEVSVLDVTPAYIATSVEMRDGTACEIRMDETDIDVVVVDDPDLEDNPDDDQDQKPKDNSQIRALYEYLKLKEIV